MGVGFASCGCIAKRKKEILTLFLWTRHSQRVRWSVHTPHGVARKAPLWAKLSGVCALSERS